MSRGPRLRLGKSPPLLFDMDNPIPLPYLCPVKPLNTQYHAFNF